LKRYYAVTPKASRNLIRTVNRRRTLINLAGVSLAENQQLATPTGVQTRRLFTHVAVI
jgi:hypothetical protein